MAVGPEAEPDSTGTGAGSSGPEVRVHAVRRTSIATSADQAAFRSLAPTGIIGLSTIEAGARSLSPRPWSARLEPRRLVGEVHGHPSRVRQLEHVPALGVVQPERPAEDPFEVPPGLGFGQNREARAEVAGSLIGLVAVQVEPAGVLENDDRIR